MPKLTGLTLEAHIDSLFSISEADTIYGYPVRKIYYGYYDYDFSVQLFGKTAATPMGPAAGPHTQLAQNILLSYLAGSRIIELKTIQILDHLKIPRPCIDMRNIGFNVEWSQELTLDESFCEYLHAWILLHLIKEKQLLGKSYKFPFYNFIFDVSVGYDLKGIRSERVQAWLNNIRNAEQAISKTMNSLPDRYRHLKDIAIPSVLADSVTLSTFHGCPPDEIEKIAEHLIEENEFNVVIKLNPTLLGYQTVHELLINKLGYDNIKLDKSAFENDLNLKQAIQMIKRLKKIAEKYNRKIGVKFTNTLLVKNTETIFNEPVRYLSGTPLYVLAMNCMKQFREKAGWDLPVSFSGGINKANFADTLTCNVVPVTACTDILKKGGYSRFTTYLESLKTAMDNTGVKTVESLILTRAGLGSTYSIQNAGCINTNNLIRQINNDPQYALDQNNTQPKTIDSKLKLFDCINCSICIPVCPNAANFYFTTEKCTEDYSDYEYINQVFRPVNHCTISVEKNQQIGTIAEFCNECGNCETFCPEKGAPFKEKPMFFIKRENFESHTYPGSFHFISANEILIRFNGIKTQLSYNADKELYNWDLEYVQLQLNENNKLIFYTKNADIKDKTVIDMTPFILSKVILKNYIANRQKFPQYLINEVS